MEKFYDCKVILSSFTSYAKRKPKKIETWKTKNILVAIYIDRRRRTHDCKNNDSLSNESP